MSNAIATLQNLGLRPLRGIYEKESDVVEKLQAVLSRELPQVYADCLRIFNVTSVFDCPVTFSTCEPPPWAENGRGRFQVWLAEDNGARSIWNARRTYLSRLPESLFVIGEAPGGNPICLDLRAEGVPVLFWDHEGAQIDNAELSNLYMIAPDFSSFVSSLKGDAERPSPDGIERVKLQGGWISPALKAKTAEFLRQQKEKKN